MTKKLYKKKYISSIMSIYVSYLSLPTHSAIRHPNRRVTHRVPKDRTHQYVYWLYSLHN